MEQGGDMKELNRGTDRINAVALIFAAKGTADKNGQEMTKPLAASIKGILGSGADIGRQSRSQAFHRPCNTGLLSEEQRSKRYDHAGRQGRRWRLGHAQNRHDLFFLHATRSQGKDFTLWSFRAIHET